MMIVMGRVGYDWAGARSSEDMIKTAASRAHSIPNLTRMVTSRSGADSCTAAKRFPQA